MSDFLQSIPRELLQTIIEYTSTHDILRLKLVSNRIYSLITSEQLFKKQKYRGYPRQTGQCAIHDIACYAKKFVDDICNFGFDTSLQLQRVMFDDALEHLVQSKTYLVSMKKYKWK